MTYGVVVEVPAPIQAYQASHAEVEKATGGVVPDGMIVHFARPTAGGFEIIEVWESKADADKFNQEVVWPAVERSGANMGTGEPQISEFEPAGLLVGKS